MESCRPGKRKRVGDDGSNDRLPCPEHAVRVLTKLSQLRARGALCDVEVRSGDCVIRAHRAVLAAASDYFSACLAGTMRESELGVITLDGIEGAVLEALVDFSYTGVIRLAEGSVEELLVAANRLAMRDVVRQCGDFLLRRLDAGNCLSILALAQTYSVESMQRQAELYVYRNFDKVAAQDEFLSVPFDQLHELLRSEALSVSGEHVVYEAALRWLRHDLPARKPHAAALLACVRMQLLPPSYLADCVQTCDIVQQSPEAAPMLLAAYQWHCGNGSGGASSGGGGSSSGSGLGGGGGGSSGALWAGRAGGSSSGGGGGSGGAKGVAAFVRRRAVRPALYAVGGDNGHDDRHPFSRVAFLHDQLGHWVEAARLMQPRSVCGVAVLNGRLFAVGGYDGERALDLVEAFDPTLNGWEAFPPMTQRRCSCACAMLEGELYVVGGVCGPVALREVERFDPTANKWVSVPPMGEGRSGCGVAVVGGLLYAVGGINGAGETVPTGECFNPATQSWRPIQALYHPRRSFGLAELGGQLYACGGNDGAFDLASVEAYDPTMNRWRIMPSMKYRRMYCSVGILNNKLYAVGGLYEDQTLSAVESFDPRSLEWTDAPPLDQRICGCGVGVLDCVSAITSGSNSGGGGADSEGDATVAAAAAAAAAAAETKE